MHPQRAALLWDSALGFASFFALLALVQAVLNLFSSSPGIWPGIVCAVFVALVWALWRARTRHLASLHSDSDKESSRSRFNS
ncbi:MAG: hypothetical protein SOW59_00250 [Corynebacterium sp.]|nr:hypothetical protein [Corynebacterium sp.]